MIRLIIAVIAGLAVAVVATVLVANALQGTANGTPSKASLYSYGER